MSWTAADTAPVDGYSWVLDRVVATTPDAISEGAATTASWAEKADGLWWFHVRARNATGTWGPTVHRAIRLDTTAPAAPAVVSSDHQDPAASYAYGSASLRFTASDDSGIDGYSYSLDQTADTVPDTTWEGSSATKNYTGLADGTHWFHVRARNNLGMWGPAAHFRIVVDSANGVPSVASNTHPYRSDWYDDDDATVNWAAAYLTGPALGWSFTLDQSPSTVPDTTSEGLTTTTAAYADLPNGTHWFHVRAQTAVTWGGTSHFALNVDDSAPSAPSVTSSTHPVESTWYPNANPSLSFPVTDTAPVDGYSWVLDQDASTTPDTTSEGTSSSVGFTGLPDGLHWFHVRARNAAGLWGATAHRAVRVDNAIPLAPSVSSSTHPVQTAWYADDAPSFSFAMSHPSGIDGYSFVLDASPATTPDTVSEGTATTKSYSGIGEGARWFHVRARSGTGIWGETAHFAVQTDVTAPASPPVSSSTHPDQTAWSAQPDAVLDFVTTDTAPVDGYSYVLDQLPTTTPDTTSEGSSATATVTPGEGTYRFHVRARNRAGLWGPTSHYILNTDAVPGTATVSSSSHPDQNDWFADRHAVLSWTTSEEAGVVGYATSVNPDAPGNPGIAVTTVTPSAEIDLFEDRVWYFNVRVKSASGAWGPTSSFRLKADTAPPAAPTASSPSHPDPNVWYTNDDPRFDFAATDSLSGIGGFSRVLDQNPSTVPDTVSEGTGTTATFTNVADGARWFHVRARDGAGNWGPTRHVQVRVDDTAPTTGTVTASPDPVNVAGVVNFSLGWSDASGADASPVRALVCRTNAVSAGSCSGGGWASGSAGTSSPRTAASSPIAVAQGTHNYWAFACDAAANCSTAAAGSFRVNAPPTLTSTSANPSEVTAGEAIVFKATWADGGDSVRAVVCKSDALSAGTCPGGYWASGGPSNTGESTATNSTTGELGTHSYWVFVCDQGALCSSPQSGIFTVNPSVVDEGYGSGGAAGTGEAIGPTAYTHPCEDEHRRLYPWRYGSSWSFRHNLLSYPGPGFVDGTSGLSPAEAKDLLRRAINSGPGGLNELRTSPDCLVYGQPWTKFADAGTYTEDPGRQDGVNGIAWIDYKNPPPTTQKTCRDNMIAYWDRRGASTCNMVNSTTNRNVEWGMTFNVNAPNPWTVRLDAPENYAIVQAVATHEILHVIGMEHTDAPPEGHPRRCTRTNTHAALTMYPCTPLHNAETGQYARKGRSNYWPYTLGRGDMIGIAELKTAVP